MTTTAIGPLTTVFQPPSSCTPTNTPQFYRVHTTGKDSDSYSYVQGPLFKPGSDCFPSGYDASPSAYYSPGVCPQGYTPACTNLNPATTTITKNSEDAPGVETAFICCPTATGIITYTCATAGKEDNKAGSPMGCQMAFSRVRGVIGATVINKDGSVGSYGVFTESEGLFAAHSIQVRFRASDDLGGGGLGLLSVPQTTTSSSSSPLTTSINGDSQQRTSVAIFSVPVETSGSSTGSGTGTGSQREETKTEGVSTGAAIGIAIGSAIAGILVVSIIGLFFFLRWRRKRRPPPVPPKESSISTNNNNPPNMENHNNDTNHTLRPPYELSEESSTASNSRSRPSQSSRRLRLMASASRRTRPSTRAARGNNNGGDQQQQQQLNQLHPAELEAVVPSSDTHSSRSRLSLRSDNRSTPESTSTGGWTLRQQRDGVTPTPWI